MLDRRSFDGCSVPATHHGREKPLHASFQPSLACFMASQGAPSRSMGESDTMQRLVTGSVPIVLSLMTAGAICAEQRGCSHRHAARTPTFNRCSTLSRAGRRRGSPAASTTVRARARFTVCSDDFQKLKTHGKHAFSSSLASRSSTTTSSRTRRPVARNSWRPACK